jgi:hypothetical protein
VTYGDNLTSEVFENALSDSEKDMCNNKDQLRMTIVVGNVAFTDHVHYSEETLELVEKVIQQHSECFLNLALEAKDEERKILVNSAKSLKGFIPSDEWQSIETQLRAFANNPKYQSLVGQIVEN